MSQWGQQFLCHKGNSENQYKHQICGWNVNEETHKQREIPQHTSKDLATNRQPPETPKIMYNWATVGPARIVVVYRSNAPFVPVLVLEKLFLKALDRTLLLKTWSSIVCCDSSYMTDSEVWLFNLLNQQYCLFGDLQRIKFDRNDRVVSLTDAKELEKILSICNRQMLLSHKFRSQRFGYVDIGGAWVPYVVVKEERWLPVFLLEYQMRTLALPHSQDKRQWELAYLKLAVRLIGEGHLLNSMEFCPCISESELKEVCERNGVGFKPTDGWPVSNILRALPPHYPGYPMVGFVWTKKLPTQKQKPTTEWYRRKVMLADR